jgi:hypothetical protein
MVALRNLVPVRLSSGLESISVFYFGEVWHNETPMVN